MQSDEESFLFKKNIKKFSMLEGSSFLPAGSVSSFMDSILTDDENLAAKLDKVVNYSEDEAQISYQVITYESVLDKACKDKDSQTESLDQSPSDKSRLQELNKTIAKLTLECNNYAKQNEDLRKEITASSQQQENDIITSLKDENKRLKSKLHVHENMVEKLIVITEEIGGETRDSEKKPVKIDFHAYNYLISKLEIVKSRMKRFYNKIQQLESDKSSINELLNFYVSAGKLIETQKVCKSACFSATPECMNPIFSSRKSSVLMESSSNIIPTPPEDENYVKKHASLRNNPSENKCLSNYPSTLMNLKGISRLTRPRNATKKGKSGNSYSVSPLIPKPKKTSKKGSESKENTRSSTIRTAKPHSETTKKKPASRCKS